MSSARWISNLSVKPTKAQLMAHLKFYWKKMLNQHLKNIKPMLNQHLKNIEPTFQKYWTSISKNVESIFKMLNKIFLFHLLLRCQRLRGGTGCEWRARRGTRPRRRAWPAGRAARGAVGRVRKREKARVWLDLRVIIICTNLKHWKMIRKKTSGRYIGFTGSRRPG